MPSIGVTSNKMLDPMKQIEYSSYATPTSMCETYIYEIMALVLLDKLKIEKFRVACNEWYDLLYNVTRLSTIHHYPTFISLQHLLVDMNHNRQFKLLIWVSECTVGVGWGYDG
jgi:hypothetical protein